MLRKFTLLLLLGVIPSLLFVGCMATKPYVEIKPQKDEAIVYVYRPESPIYRGTPYFVYINGKKIGTIINAAYLPARVKPGNNTISLKENTLFEAPVDRKEYKFEKNGTYYIRVNSGLFGAFTLEKVPNNIGSKEILKTKFYEDSIK